VYRDKSREAQVLNIGTVNDGKAPAVEVPEPAPRFIEPRPRPDLLNGSTRQVKTSCGSIYVTINEDDKGIFEIFNQMGKAGGCAASQSEAIGRLASLALRAGIRPELIVKQLRGISCHKPIGFGNGKVHSCADAIASCLAQYLENQALFTGDKPVNEPLKVVVLEKKRSAYLEPEGVIQGACPECGGQVERQEGCLKCHSCGYSEC